ncbi:hypothetical protein NEIELOOT_02109 [Neisseria elongata subsp. glycolytica ATCC 29315]|uniref:Uncharacterized protein n=1 Tax=Neisseria elongata subsp. glycolytica ATCC 29315 TaxID=546263 RepID=D4DSR4_NEIEG|nr:hypothetical protein NEIELOOT_02109 [Neisseria elongata subsp. glycolytica ATCC 29315]
MCKSGSIVPSLRCNKALQTENGPHEAGRLKKNDTAYFRVT